jgi:putative transposase
MYNHTLKLLREDPKLKNTKYTLRDKVKEKFSEEIKESCIPNTSAEYSVFDAILAFKQSDKAQDKVFNKTSHSIAIDGRCIKNGVIYPRNTKKWLKQKYSINASKIFTSIKNEKLESNKSICRLVYKRLLNTFYLCCPISLEEKNKPLRHIISLDPGVRSFLTFYDGESCGEIGKNIHVKLKRLSKNMDKLDEKINNTNNMYKKRNLKKAKTRIQEKKKNIVDDLHKKACNFLKQYEYILLPIFKVKGMIKSLPKPVKRSLLDLSHFKFRLRLIQKTSEIGSKVLLCNEIMTSKTCTCCGEINEHLGKSKTFKCPACNITIDRDVNGARNILLRALRISST